MSNKLRGLIVDILFPNKYSKWRNVEIKSFIENYDVDILVHKINNFANVNYEFDWDFINSENLLEGYNIIIFDKNFNYLNKWNLNLDGTQYNTNNNFSYLITKNDNFDLNSYDFVYHIFLMCYGRFNSIFNFNLNQQFIHLYPGGGFNGDVTNLPNEVNIISTHPITTKNLNSVNHQNYTEVLIGSLMEKNEKLVTFKDRTDRPFTICFSSMGFGDEKGYGEYMLLSKEYTSLYPNDNVRFISIGNNVSTLNITNYPPMDYLSLGDFYEKNVDVYINLATKKEFNGWPIGLESVIKGCVLITTDPDNIKDEYSKLTDDEFYVINNYQESIPILKLLFENDGFLNYKFKQGQEYFNQYLNYNDHQNKIFNFINHKLHELKQLEK
jgi:hypothetical protein